MKKSLFLAAVLLVPATSLLAQPTLPRNQRIPKVQNNEPNLNVTPNPMTGGPVPMKDLAERLKDMDERLLTLEKQNADLKKQVSDLESKNAQTMKDMVALKLLVPAMDKAITKTYTDLNKSIGKTNTDLATFKTEYSKHSHKTNFSFQTFDFLTQTAKSNKENFYMPFIWLNSQGEVGIQQKIKNAQPYLNLTTNPLGPDGYPLKVTGK